MSEQQYNNYTEAENSTCTQDYSNFANPTAPYANDINYLYRHTVDEVANTNDESYPMKSFKADLYSALTYYYLEIKRTQPNATEFVRTTTIAVMPEGGQDDGETGRFNEYPLPVDCMELIRVEYACNMCAFKELKQTQHNNMSKCGSSEAYDEKCNTNMSCNNCNDEYLKQNNSIILPFCVTKSGKLRITYYQAPVMPGKDTLSINFPPYLFNVITHYCALRYLKRHDGQASGRYGDIVEWLKRYEAQLYNHYSNGDSAEINF